MLHVKGLHGKQKNYDLLHNGTTCYTTCYTTLATQWNIVPDETITNYTPHTIAVDTHLRKNTDISKNDIAIVTETKPRLIHLVACKIFGEYKRNKEKIRKFCLEEASNNPTHKALKEPVPSSSSMWTRDRVKKIAKKNSAKATTQTPI